MYPATLLAVIADPSVLDGQVERNPFSDTRVGLTGSAPDSKQKTTKASTQVPNPYIPPSQSGPWRLGLRCSSGTLHTDRCLTPSIPSAFIPIVSALGAISTIAGAIAPKVDDVS